MRNASLDQAKLVMALMVLCIHSSFFKVYSESVNYFLVQSVFRVAVPLFFIISGFYFYSFLAKGGKLKQWLVRLLVMHTIWSVVYAYFYLPFGDGFSSIVIEFIKRYIEGYLHLWFLMAMIGGGILLVFLRRLKDAYLLLLLVVVFFAGALIQYMGSYHVFSGAYLDKLFNKTHIYRNFFFVGFPFLAVGYLIAKYKKQILERKNVIWLAFWVGVILLLLEGALNLSYVPSYKENFDILFSLIVVCPAVFILLLSSKRSVESPVFSDISACVYFTHPLFIEIFSVAFGGHGLVTLLTLIFSCLSYFVLLPVNNKYRYVF